MAKFHYEGYQDGKAVKGTVEASDKESAAELVERMNIRATYLKVERSNILSKDVSLLKLRPVNRRTIMIFTHQLAAMLGAGVQVTEALRTLGEEQSDPRFRDALEDIRRDIEGGSTLSEALRRHPKLFDYLYCNMVESGEQSGRVDHTLNKVVEGMERSENLTRKVKKALTYPGILITFAIAVVIFVVSFVVPRFEPLYAQFDTELPRATQIVVEFSGLLRPPDGGLIPVRPLLWIGMVLGVSLTSWMIQRGREGWGKNLVLLGTLAAYVAGTYLILQIPGAGSLGHADANIAMIVRFILFGAMVFAAWRAISFFLETPGGRYAWDRTKIRLPFVGKVLHKVALARFATTLSVLYAAGVDLTRALEYSAPATGNVVMSDAIKRIRKRILDGENMGDAFRKEKIIPSIMTSMIAVADQSSGLDVQLIKVAKYFEDDVDSVINNIDAWIEPIMLGIVGLAVGSIVIALYLPLWALFDELSDLIF